MRATSKFLEKEQPRNVYLLFLYQTRIHGIRKRDKTVKEHLVVDYVLKKANYVSFVYSVLYEKVKNVNPFTVKIEEATQSRENNHIFKFNNEWYENLNDNIYINGSLIDKKTWVQTRVLDSFVDEILSEPLSDDEKLNLITMKPGHTLSCLTEQYMCYEMEDCIKTKEVMNFKSIVSDNKDRISKIIEEQTNTDFLVTKGNSVFKKINFEYLLTRTKYETDWKYMSEKNITIDYTIEGNEKWTKFSKIVDWIRNQTNNIILDENCRKKFDTIKNDFNSCHPHLINAAIDKNYHLTYHKVKPFLDKLNLDIDLEINENVEIIKL